MMKTTEDHDESYHYTDDSLHAKTKDMLLKIAKAKGIIGRHEMTKAELIDAIIKEKSKEVGYDIAKRIKYINECKIGTIVAFKDTSRSDGKYRTGKIVSKNAQSQNLLIETEYEAIYNVSYIDVIWVKTGDRWPRKIYDILKGK